MRKIINWQLIGIVGLGSLGILGCGHWRSQSSQPAQQTASASEVVAIAQADRNETAITDYPAQTVTYEVCGELPNWERLSLAEQTAELQNHPRYGSALETDPLKSLFDKFWQQSVITFTTYGLSARMEPLYLSGVWTGIEAMEACYEGDRTDAINQGDRGEIWLIGHQIVDMVWTGDAYQITVETTDTGLQFVQFDRLEQAPRIAITVSASSGEAIAVAAGDWSAQESPQSDK